jgi:hypothetical protein
MNSHGLGEFSEPNPWKVSTPCYRGAVGLGRAVSAGGCLAAMMAYRSAVEFPVHVFHGLHSLRSFHRMAIHGEPSGFTV